MIVEQITSMGHSFEAAMWATAIVGTGLSLTVLAFLYGAALLTRNLPWRRLCALFYPR